ncbi:MAG: helix-turn-helix domain-containing protein [Bacteroidetes bacterium]|nr:helix-turn-helix domain-containing protein [Bacteroidota bacterium]
MIDFTENQYKPDFVFPPGDTLLEILESKDMMQTEFAKRVGITTKTVNEIIKGKAPITPENALKFERVTGIPASFWNNYERIYREFLENTREKNNLAKNLAWLKNFPLKEMIEYSYIPEDKEKVDTLSNILNFFGIASPDQWENVWIKMTDKLAFRQSRKFQPDNFALSAWLRKGQIESYNYECKPFNKDAFLKALESIRHLTKEHPKVFTKQMMQFCANAGVALILVPELPKTRVNGVAYWINKDKALIQMSLYNKYADIFWFSFFHEAGHLLKHGKTEWFIDIAGEVIYRGGDSKSIVHEDKKEKEADKFASDFLIPFTKYGKFISDGSFSDYSIKAFAESIGISFGIVVGRLQHDNYIPYSRGNRLRIKYIWKKSNSDD